ncbi:hypothetical protein KP803_08130 [Vibrio sp. ZSDE26]|uniref:Glycosyltransferase n=1 Tax=Vibrio amylolyticus TaxID=2847292 RepID=A0A9X2BKU7_9VIBR|nr:hypothetical protein [Vibrio amylolyticus]MCK6263243.1 hypothetical protein [Vibrio amylolyticus]
MNKINFKKRRNAAYKQVQSNINESIINHLDCREYSNKPIYHPRLINITYFIRQEADVLMSHGVADKNYLSMRDSEGRMINKFQHVLVPGPWLKNRLMALPGLTLKEDQIHVVGWPRLDPLCKVRKKYLEQKGESSQPNVLWAPTHDHRKRGKSKESTSSYPRFGEHSEEMNSLYNYTIALHPRNRTSKEPTTVSLAESDFVISDFGTMVYEAWALGIPVIFPRWILKDRVIKYVKGSAEAYIFENNIGLHAESIEDVHRIISENKPLGDDVKLFMEQYLPSEYLGNSGMIIAEKLRTLPIQRSYKRIFGYYWDYAKLRFSRLVK